MRLSAFDFYAAEIGRDEKVSEAKISSKYLSRQALNTTRNEHGGVEIYKNLCRQSRRACFALNGHPYLRGSEISDVLKASATSEALENPSSKTMKPRNPQGYTEAVERYDTNPLIPIHPVRLSRRQEHRKPVAANNVDERPNPVQPPPAAHNTNINPWAPKPTSPQEPTTPEHSTALNPIATPPRQKRPSEVSERRVILYVD